MHARTHPPVSPYPTLLLLYSRRMDIITPAFHSFEMADRIPNATLKVYELGSHFTILEYVDMQVADPTPMYLCTFSRYILYNSLPLPPLLLAAT